MFNGASSFNSDISSWEINNETVMTSMFLKAAAFNQDLCAWGKDFPYKKADSIFLQSGCSYPGAPKESERGPFCGSKCDNYEVPSSQPSVSLGPTVSRKPSLQPSVRVTPPPTFLSTFIVTTANPETNAPTISLAPTSTRPPSREPSRSSSPTETCSFLNIDIVYDDYPYELSWNISRVTNDDDGSYKLIQSYQETIVKETGAVAGITYNDTLCLSPGRYQFIILDSFGDGLTSSSTGVSGSYNLNKDGEIIVSGGDYGKGEITTFDWPLFNATTVNTTRVDSQ